MGKNLLKASNHFFVFLEYSNKCLLLQEGRKGICFERRLFSSFNLEKKKDLPLNLKSLQRDINCFYKNGIIKYKNETFFRKNVNYFSNGTKLMNTIQEENKKVLETNHKTKKQIYTDKKYKEQIIKMYLLLSLILIPSGYFIMSCVQNNLTFDDVLCLIKKKIELWETQYTEAINDFVDSYFPLSSEPLLPDFKDLNYPEHLPTLVVDLNYVIANLEYDRKNGWRVLKRPYADLFFRELSSFYEIVIWSDDSFPVAQEVISKWGIPAIGCLHRDQCTKKKKGFVKDLRRLGRNLDRVVVIDHDPHSFMLNPQNAILIKEFQGNTDDKELLCLIDLLKSIAVSTDDVKETIKKYGGGDYDIGRRYLRLKNDSEQKSNRVRNFGRIFSVDSKRTSNGISF